MFNALDLFCSQAFWGICVSQLLGSAPGQILAHAGKIITNSILSQRTQPFAALSAGRLIVTLAPGYGYLLVIFGL